MRTYFLLFCTLLFSNASLLAQSWDPIADIPTGRHHPVTFSLDGKGYAVTGNINQSTVTKTFYEYDPVSDTWTTLTDFPGVARGFSIGLAYDGLGYLGFGATSSQYLDDLWSYDPQTDQWTQLASCPCASRTHPAMIAQDGKIYVGLGSNGANLDDWWEYTIATDSWTQMVDLPGPPRHHPYQFAAGGGVYAGMGHGNGIFNDWYKLDTAANAFVAVANFPGEARVAGTQFDHDDYGYVLSGDGDNHSWMPTGELWRYDPFVDTWTQLTPHPGISRWAPGSFVIDNEVFFFGGVNRQTNTYPTAAYKYELSPPSVGIDEGSDTDLTVYPNPFDDRIFVGRGNTGNMRYQVWNMDGKLIQQGAITQGYIDTNTIQNGLFVLEVQSPDGNIVARKQLVKLNR